MDISRLSAYADLIVKKGVNPDPGQDVIIIAGLDQVEFVRMVVEKCYLAGAGKVVVDWVDMPRVFLPPIMDTVMYGNIPNEDVAKIVECVEKGVKEAVGTLIVEFDSFGKAPLVEMVTLDEMAERYKKAGI